MRILFGSGEPYLPSFRGGAECSIDELARALITEGHSCEVVVGVRRGDSRRPHRIWRLLSANPGIARRDLRNGYPTHRAAPRALVEALRERLAGFRPDLVVAWNRASEELARAAAAVSIPSLVWVHDAELAWSHGRLPPEPTTRLAAVSEFLAQRVGEHLGRRVAVLRPLIRFEDYRCGARRPELVTLVNPRESKGVSIALAIAERLPGRRFLFVGSPGLLARERTALAARVARLRNVRVERQVSDMRPVYARTALLLAPSICEDAAPRVVLEAHLNGIPVVGSRIGGIPEVSGGAAVLLPASAPPDRWAAEVERLLGDPALLGEIAARSRANAARPELQSAAILESFLQLAAG
ncbi:MAG TPA: glycosyltransferase [Myxococcota bacterium]|jgi:glycosyltransferase involved in cell wall biosynthesis